MDKQLTRLIGGITTVRQPSALSTSELLEIIEHNAAIQKLCPPDSRYATEARTRNRPLFDEMSKRQDAPPVR